MEPALRTASEASDDPDDPPEAPEATDLGRPGLRRNGRVRTARSRAPGRADTRLRAARRARGRGNRADARAVVDRRALERCAGRDPTSRRPDVVRAPLRCAG